MLEFAIGERDKTILVQVEEDQTSEGDERFTVELYDAQGFFL